MSEKGIDPRGPRFGAGISAVLMLVIIYLSLNQATVSIALGIMGFAVVMFTIGSILGPQGHPYGYIYKALIRPQLKDPSYLEDSRPVRFAQQVGLFVTGSGFVLHLLAVPNALPIAAAAAFMAAFLNAAFAYCLGCQMYLGLKRFGLIKN
jgi:hypothetical protein